MTRRSEVVDCSESVNCVGLNWSLRGKGLY